MGDKGSFVVTKLFNNQNIISFRKLISIVALTACSFTASSSFAAVMLPGLPSNEALQLPSAENSLSLLHNIYMYQQQTMSAVNWLYIGYAPRMEDENRIQVFLSKRGYTMRVETLFTPYEISDYPRYLVQRYFEVRRIKSAEQVQIFQTRLWQQYERMIGEIMSDYDTSPGYSEEKYQAGLKLLKRFFPKNVVVRPGRSPAEPSVELHAVYPITINRNGLSFPRNGTYRLYYQVEERRSLYTKNGSHIFNGHPAFWLDPTGAGVGVHGPIRYSQSDESNNGRQRTPYGNSREGISQFWGENNFLNEDIDPREGLNVRFRFDVVRTNDSAGCFRAETVELRHLLPSDPTRVSQVRWHVIDTFDKVTFDPSIGPQDVNIEYYLTNPYEFPDKERWGWNHLLTPNERNSGNGQQILEKKWASMRTFPYLNPNTIEFAIPSGGAAERVMRQFNRISLQ